ncbi:unnamed protein product [Cylindrotheca closterium]|uniref:PH domain-containing protein n=1 Tax=Cylindrotheca closterium TaxID=2856 RepID=A0AAD2CYI2_9STRA|nr:unnamed protein product [Cylindrotheca closterium]
MMMNHPDSASVTPSVEPSVLTFQSVTPSVRRQFGDYEERFQQMDNEIDAIRTSFDLDPNEETRLDLSVLEGRIDELENAENRLLSERHRLHQMLLSEKEKLIQMREEERLKKLSEQQMQQYDDQNETPTQKQRPTTIPFEITSPSQKRANEFRNSSIGLFEISKQLQISQAKIEAQGVEINRLERQLRLLAELQGVNVADLRKALEQACADEAYGEMQHRIAFLEAELEASQLMQKGPPRRNNRSEEEEEEEDGKNNNDSEEMDALRFQVQQQQMDIHRLKSMLEEKDQRIEELSMAHRKSVQALDAGANAMSQEYEELLGLVAAKDDALEEARIALEAEREKSLEHERQLVLNNEKIRQKEMKQIKERHFDQVLALEKKIIRTENSCDDRIKDMEQQLKSLYVAVGCINEDHDVEKEHRSRLSNDLKEADFEVANQLNVAERRSTTASGGESGGGLYSTLLMNELMSLKEEAAMAESSVAASADIPPLMAFAMTGTLLIKNKGVVGRKWKPKHSRLFLCGDHYQLDIGEKSYDIQFGISKVDFNPNHPLSFVIQTDPNDPRAHNISAAASNEDDYHKWISALSKATTGED